jgi:signal transduction histidine kinase
VKDLKSSRFRIAVLSAMALLWVLVASLQYKWASQLSSATELRLGTNLRSLMTIWQRDLYDELSAICVTLQVGPDSGAHDAWNDYLQRYAAWTGDGVNSHLADGGNVNKDLVREVYEWRTSLPGNPLLLRLNPKSMALDGVVPPTNLEMLLARLQANSANLRVAMEAWEFPKPSGERVAQSHRSGTPSSRSDALAGWQLDETIPALVHPVVHHRDPLSSITPVDRVEVDWFVVVLDDNVIRNRVLPELAARRFGGPDGLEYKLAVVALGGDPQIVYASDRSLTIKEAETFDLTMSLSGSPAVNPLSDTGQAANRARNLQDQDWRASSAPVWFPVIQYGPQDQAWVLFLQHGTGPVSQIARRTWYRDLMIGGVVLSLLAVNMGLVVYSSLRAQRLARVQMEFVASVSHELRTPLAAIFSASENIRDGFVEGKKNLQFYGSILTSQARQLIDLVDRILMFASTRTGKTTYSVKPLAVEDILAAVRKNVSEGINEQGCRLEEQIDPNLPPALGDLSAVCACLQNLIANAMKYGGVERWIGLSVSCHHAGENRKEIRFTVQDHGDGIASNELQHIFEPFYRSPKVVAAQVHGTGLGLALAKRIAEALGGKISVVSELGVGSTFTLHLRATEVPEISEQPQFKSLEELSHE